MTSIRRMTIADVTDVRGLLTQLDYEMDAREVARRHEAVARAEDHAALVAEQGGRVVALLHVYARPAFDKPPEAIVQALVVDRSCRGGGVGKAMMAAAEAWAAERGFASVALASHVSRPDAHAFYQAIGYRLAATSLLLRKELPQMNISAQTHPDI